jgi:SAM-dependent methyltransferase
MAAMRPRLDPADHPDWGAYYRAYQARLIVDHLVPCLIGWGAWRPGARILDVGCGDGGAALALAAAGAAVDGIEIESRRLEGARQEAARRGFSLRLAVADITDPTTLGDFAGPYDLILFRDVLEHIPDLHAALTQAAGRLGEQGRILVVFPPWASPYGGHQQLLHPPRRLALPWARLPWAHLLPHGLFRALQQGRDGSDDPQWGELETIRAARLTFGRMAHAASDAGLVQVAAKHWLLRPSFHLRYGWPVVPAGPLAAIPGLRELLVTGSYQLFAQRM